VLDDFFFVERGYLNANHFVYRADEPVLIDTGYLSGFGETEQRIRDLGVELSRTGLIITTHCHCDHVGGNHRIQVRSGCDIAAHKIGKAFIDARDDRATWWGYFEQEAEFFHCTRGLEDGEVLSVGPHRLRVIHTPGHSADGMVLYHEEEKLLFSSDTLWENDLPVFAVRLEGNGALLSMAESLEKLEPLHVKTVFPGHGRPFCDFREAVSRAKNRLQASIESPDRVGNHLLKRIMAYTLLMREPIRETTFFRELMGTRWFPETVDFYFHGEYERTYQEILRQLLDRRAVRIENRALRAAVKP
jgi:glyoxylase-like metal-dependent hydrolase (beta-lactamase superfamily II)